MTRPTRGSVSLRSEAVSWSAQSGRRLRAAIRNSGYKINDFALACGVSRSSLYRCIGGDAPTAELVERFASLLDVDAAHLIDGGDVIAARLIAACETGRSFRVAIDALRVGRKVRTRLLTHVDAHIAALEALAK